MAQQWLWPSGRVRKPRSLPRASTFYQSQNYRVSSLLVSRSRSSQPDLGLSMETAEQRESAKRQSRTEACLAEYMPAAVRSSRRAQATVMAGKVSYLSKQVTYPT